MNNKNTQSRNYSFVALIVAGLAVIAAILLGITRGLVAMQVFTVAKIDNLNHRLQERSEAPGCARVETGRLDS